MFFCVKNIYNFCHIAIEIVIIKELNGVLLEQTYLFTGACYVVLQFTRHISIYAYAILTHKRMEVKFHNWKSK